MNWCGTGPCSRSLLLPKVTDGGQATAFRRRARPLQTWHLAIYTNHGAVIYLQESHVHPPETRITPLAEGSVLLLLVTL